MLPINKVGCRLGGFQASLGEQRVIRGQRAGGVGPGSVAGQREGLAAATAPVDFTPFAGPARLGHPFGATEAGKGRRMIPNIAEARLGYSRELQTWQGLRRMARQ